eukprot:gb/GEZN01007555.1/.p1 GENE.gb/GEZN01007555.1/~~gb/GEZN01007555.1/.p1  ORF type:complete len:469 (+),score=69.52 gb/GEZN01007555.1/:165-1409(+)
MSGARLFHSSGPAGQDRQQPFQPTQGVESVVLRPGPAGAAFLGPMRQKDVECVFDYRDLKTLQKSASVRDAWLYGAVLSERSKKAVPTGLVGDLIKGKLLCWREGFEEILTTADSLYEYKALQPEQGAVRRAVVSVVVEDGSSHKAYFFHQGAVCPAVIIGGGRIGQALADMGVPGDVILRRGEPFPINAPAGPIFVCTRNDVLTDVIANVPEVRRKDLVFLQNGMLQPFLEKQGLGDNTQALIYFAVAKLGDPPTDGVTALNPDGLTAATGPWAHALANRLHSGNMACHVLNAQEFQGSMYEKLIWISSFMLVGAQHPGATVGDVATKHKEEVVSLIQELLSGTSFLTGTDFAPGAMERLLAYAGSVAHFPTAVKEFEWRNGYFYGLSQAALAESKPDPFPTHTKLLQAIKAV